MTSAALGSLSMVCVDPYLKRILKEASQHTWCFPSSQFSHLLCCFLVLTGLVFMNPQSTHLTQGVLYMLFPFCVPWHGNSFKEENQQSWQFICSPCLRSHMAAMPEARSLIIVLHMLSTFLVLQMGIASL